MTKFEEIKVRSQDPQVTDCMDARTLEHFNWLIARVEELEKVGVADCGCPMAPARIIKHQRGCPKEFRPDFSIDVEDTY